MTVIDLNKYIKNKRGEVCPQNEKPKVILRKSPKNGENFEERTQRIRESLEKISRLMEELKQLSEEKYDKK